MSTVKWWLNKQTIPCMVLLIILLLVVFFYYQTTVSSTPISGPVQAVTVIKPEIEDPIDSTKINRPIAITPEEKRVVEEKEHLQKIVVAGQQHVQSLQTDEQALYEQDQQAKADIAKLEEQVKRLSKGLSK